MLLDEKIRETRLRKPVHFPTISLGGNGRDEMARLVRNFTTPRPSMTGDGRFISCGHSYWGVGPTIAWHNACTDPLYPIGRLSVEKFADAWHALISNDGHDVSEDRHALPGTYVSLGPGTGEKDVTVLKSLVHTDCEPHYIGVDVSAEMLRLQLESHGDAEAALREMVAVQLDFSLPAEVRKLRMWLDNQVGQDVPILFSMLGNTLANFPDDKRLLRSLADGLLTHEQDHLLLEVATSSRIDQQAAENAATEYGASQGFLDWVTSALAANTQNLAIDHQAVQFLPSVEADRALVLKVVYTNTSTDTAIIKLMNGRSFPFPPKDTVRLELTRKYHPEAVTDLLADASLVVCGREHTELDDDDDNSDFGLELVLSRRDVSACPPSRGPGFFKRRGD